MCICQCGSEVETPGLRLCDKCLMQEVEFLDKCYSECGPMTVDEDSPKAMGWVGHNGQP